MPAHTKVRWLAGAGYPSRMQELRTRYRGAGAAHAMVEKVGRGGERVGGAEGFLPQEKKKRSPVTMFSSARRAGHNGRRWVLEQLDELRGHAVRSTVSILELSLSSSVKYESDRRRQVRERWS